MSNFELLFADLSRLGDMALLLLNGVLLASVYVCISLLVSQFLTEILTLFGALALPGFLNVCRDLILSV